VRGISQQRLRYWITAAGALKGSVGAAAAARYHTAFDWLVANAREPVVPKFIGVAVA
jgi:hypothetical protein